MDGQAIALLLAGLVVLDVAGLLILLFLVPRIADRRRARKQQSQCEFRVPPLPSQSRERYTQRLREVDRALEESKSREALEAAEQLLEDILYERGFPEKSRKNGRRLSSALHAVNPEAAGKYAAARSRRAMASGAWKREKAARLEEAAREYRALCEALIGAGETDST